MFEKIPLTVNKFFRGIFSLFLFGLFTFFLSVNKNKSIMSRSVNKCQSEIILSRMQENRSTACGFVKESRETVPKFWNCLANELNSAGPPTKNVTEWKKVWTDQKRYVRSKAAANKKNQQASGGWPNQNKYMSDTEKCIYELVGMKEAIEGVENAVDFGFNKSSDDHEKENEPPTQSLSFVDMVGEVLEEISGCSNIIITPPPPKEAIINEEPTCSSGKRSAVKRKFEETQKLSTADLIAKELQTQEKLFSKVCSIAENVQSHYKEVEAMVKRVYRALEKNNDLKSKQLIEFQRQNEVCEKLRLKEVESRIEKNKKLIEIEEMKLAIMQKKYSKK